ncbi:MAG: hypothetical protein DRG83_07145, partial [Deltaproteobacteria bacterium]
MIEEFRDMVRILEEHPEWRDELRRVLLTDDLLELPRIVRELAKTQQTMGQQLQRLTERIDVLTEQVQNLTEKVDAFV